MFCPRLAAGTGDPGNEFKKQRFYHLCIHPSDVDELFAAYDRMAVFAGKDGRDQYDIAVDWAAKAEFDQYRRGNHSRYDLQFSAIYGTSDLQFAHQDPAGYLRCGKRSWGKLDTDIVADHIATDSSGNCQRYYDGICAGDDNICHFKLVRRSEDQSDRKCDRAGIYDGQ